MITSKSVVKWAADSKAGGYVPIIAIPPVPKMDRGNLAGDRDSISISGDS